MSLQHQLQAALCLGILTGLFLLLPHNLSAKTQVGRPAEEMILNKRQKNYVPVRTQTIGIAEKMVTNDQGKSPEPADRITETSSPHKSIKQKKTKSTKTAAKLKSRAKPDQQQVQQPNRQQPDPISTMLEDVRLDFSECFYHPLTNSVACKMELTNLAADCDVTFFCYSGTQAEDSGGNVKECAHTWIGSNHSWNYAVTRLHKGTPQKAMVRFKTGGRLNSLSMQLVFAINDVRKMVTLSNVPVTHK